MAERGDPVERGKGVDDRIFHLERSHLVLHASCLTASDLHGEAHQGHREKNQRPGLHRDSLLNWRTPKVTGPIQGFPSPTGRRKSNPPARRATSPLTMASQFYRPTRSPRT